MAGPEGAIFSGAETGAQLFIGVPGSPLPVESDSIAISRLNLHAHRVRARLAGEGLRPGLEDLISGNHDVDTHPAALLVPCHEHGSGFVEMSRASLRQLLEIDFTGDYPKAEEGS